MRIIDLDGTRWREVMDFYRAILPAIGAPRWHGESVNALVDSMIWGRINAVDPPYKVRIRGTARMPKTVLNEVEQAEQIVRRQRRDHLRWHKKDVEVELILMP